MNSFLSGVRSYVLGAALSYRALFTWLNPLGYLSSRVVRPIGTAIVFTSAFHYFGADVARVLVGSSLLAAASAVIFGMGLAVGNERTFGTLSFWLSSPQHKLAAVCQRALPHLLDGYLGGLLTYLICCGLYQRLPVPVPAFAGLLLVAVLTSFGLGMVVCALAVMVRDPFVAPNAAEMVLMVLSGTLIAVADLPLILRWTSEAVPLSHLMTAAGAYLATGSWPWPEIRVELVTGAVWFTVGAVLLHVATRRAGRTAVAD